MHSFVSKMPSGDLKPKRISLHTKRGKLSIAGKLILKSKKKKDKGLISSEVYRVFDSKNKG
jgi:hypothetical protein